MDISKQRGANLVHQASENDFSKQQQPTILIHKEFSWNNL